MLSRVIWLYSVNHLFYMISNTCPSKLLLYIGLHMTNSHVCFVIVSRVDCRMCYETYFGHHRPSAVSVVIHYCKALHVDLTALHCVTVPVNKCSHTTVYSTMDEEDQDRLSFTQYKQQPLIACSVDQQTFLSLL